MREVQSHNEVNSGDFFIRKTQKDTIKCYVCDKAPAVEFQRAINSALYLQPPITIELLEYESPLRMRLIRRIEITNNE